MFRNVADKVVANLIAVVCGGAMTLGFCELVKIVVG